MRRLIVSLLGATILSVTAAQAADMPVKAPRIAPPVLYNWTGFYIGINGGGGWGRSDWSSPVADTGNFNISGGLVGGTIGYNWQITPWVFGLEGDLDWTNIRGSTNAAACAGTCETKNNWLGTVRGRIGYAFDRVMPYITGGLAVGDIKATLSPPGGTTTKTEAGWTAGGGVEFAVAGPWTAKVEYLYVDLSKGSCDITVCTTGAASVKFQANLVRAGVNYRF